MQKSLILNGMFVINQQRFLCITCELIKTQQQNSKIQSITSKNFRSNVQNVLKPMHYTCYSKTFFVRSVNIILHLKKFIMNCLITIFNIRKQQFTSKCLPMYCAAITVNNTAFKIYCLTRQPLDLSLHCILL